MRVMNEAGRSNYQTTRNIRATPTGQPVGCRAPYVRRRPRYSEARPRVSPSSWPRAIASPTADVFSRADFLLHLLGSARHRWDLLGRNQGALLSELSQDF